MTILGWHFLYPGSLLRNGESAPPDGEWLSHDGPVIPCESGLHASTSALDALRYAPPRAGAVLCRVELDGEIVEHGNPVDKLVASRRRILWRLDGATTDAALQVLARKCALRVVGEWDAPKVVREYLKTGYAELRSAAYEAARAASETEHLEHARCATQAALWAAQENTGVIAAYSAADAAEAAAAEAASAKHDAWDEAWDEEWNWQNRELERMLEGAHAKAVAT